MFDDDALCNVTSDGLDGCDLFANGSESNVTSRGDGWMANTTTDFRLATAGIAVFGLIGRYCHSHFGFIGRYCHSHFGLIGRYCHSLFGLIGRYCHSHFS